MLLKTSLYIWFHKKILKDGKRLGVVIYETVYNMDSEKYDKNGILGTTIYKKLIKLISTFSTHVYQKCGRNESITTLINYTKTKRLHKIS